MAISMVEKCNLNKYLKRKRDFDSDSVIFWHWDHAVQNDYVRNFRAYTSMIKDQRYDDEQLDILSARCRDLENRVRLRDKYQDVEDANAKVRYCKIGYRRAEQAFEDFHPRSVNEPSPVLFQLERAEEYLDHSIKEYLEARSQFFESLTEDERTWYQEIWKKECW